MSNWRVRRQISYLSLVTGFIVLVALGLYFYSRPTATCFDGVKNGQETGVDCGGLCQRACVVETLPLKILWTRILEAGAGRYDVAAMIDNFNGQLGIKNISYVLRIYDKDGALITDKSGTTFVNPLEKIVIFEPGLITDKRVAASAELTITDQSDWLKIAPETARVTMERVIDGGSFTTDSSPRLHYRISNNSLLPLSSLIVTVVLNDENQNAYAGSQTQVDLLAAGETKDIYFTWPAKLSRNPASIDAFWRRNVFNR
jgi:hypothetical protein